MDTMTQYVKVLIVCCLLAAGCHLSMTAQNTVRIDATKTHQRITGFGGFVCSPSFAYGHMSNAEIDKVWGESEVPIRQHRSLPTIMSWLSRTTSGASAVSPRQPRYSRSMSMPNCLPQRLSCPYRTSVWALQKTLRSTFGRLLPTGRKKSQISNLKPSTTFRAVASVSPRRVCISSTAVVSSSNKAEKGE